MILILDDEQFEHFMHVMQSKDKPTPAMYEAAERIRAFAKLQEQRRREREQEIEELREILVRQLKKRSNLLPLDEEKYATPEEEAVAAVTVAFDKNKSELELELKSFLSSYEKSS